jgi:hypothetical protein
LRRLRNQAIRQSGNQATGNRQQAKLYTLSKNRVNCPIDNKNHTIILSSHAPWTALFPCFSWSFAVGKTPILKIGMGINNSARRALFDECIAFRRRKKLSHTENAARIYAGMCAAVADFKEKQSFRKAFSYYTPSARRCIKEKL